MGKRCEWIPEENQVVQFLVGDHGSELHVSTIGPAFEQSDFQTCFFHNSFPGFSSGVQVVKLQRAFIEIDPFYQIVFPVVVRYQSDVPFGDQDLTVSNWGRWMRGRRLRI